MDPDPRSPASAGIRIFVDDAGWRRVSPRAEAFVRRAARLVARDQLSIVLTDDRTVRRLNARHRGRDRPTNVLTFEAPSPGLPGEIILARGTIGREAIAAGRTMTQHLAHLVVHGALHLAGHDHHRAGEARRMEMAEARLLSRIGVANPWRPRQVAAR